MKFTPFNFKRLPRRYHAAVGFAKSSVEGTNADLGWCLLAGDDEVIQRI